MLGKIGFGSLSRYNMYLGFQEASLTNDGRQKASFPDVLALSLLTVVKMHCTLRLW